MEEFLDAIVAGRPLSDSVSEGLGEVLFAKAVYKSLVSKQWESTHPDNLLDYWDSKADLFQSTVFEQVEGKWIEYIYQHTEILSNQYCLPQRSACYIMCRGFPVSSSYM